MNCIMQISFQASPMYGAMHLVVAAHLKLIGLELEWWMGVDPADLDETSVVSNPVVSDNYRLNCWMSAVCLEGGLLDFGGFLVCCLLLRRC
jgi:hypothetical protein